MIRIKSAVWTIILLAVGIVIGAHLFAKQPVKAEYVFDRAVLASNKTNYKATNVCTYRYFGKEKKYQATSDCRHNASLNSQYAPIVKKNYELVLGGEYKIAGRGVWVLALLPKQRHFPWKEIWVDKKTYVVLASKDWSSQNNVKRSMKTLKIKYLPDNEIPQSANANTSTASQMPAHSYIPKGFICVSSKSDFKSSRNVYSNGITTISICSKTAPIQNATCKPSISDCGQALIYSKYTNGKDITIIADLPEEELSKIAASIN